VHYLSFAGSDSDAASAAIRNVSDITHGSRLFISFGGFGFVDFIFRHLPAGPTVEGDFILVFVPLNDWTANGSLSEIEIGDSDFKNYYALSVFAVPYNWISDPDSLAAADQRWRCSRSRWRNL
jgi:hypothetical protein